MITEYNDKLIKKVEEITRKECRDAMIALLEKIGEEVKGVIEWIENQIENPITSTNAGHKDLQDEREWAFNECADMLYDLEYSILKIEKSV